MNHFAHLINLLIKNHLNNWDATLYLILLNTVWLNMWCLEKSTKNPGRHKKVVRCRTIQIVNELSKHVIPFATHDPPPLMQH